MNRGFKILILSAITLAASLSFARELTVDYVYEKYECDNRGVSQGDPSLLVDSHDSRIPKNIRQGILNTDTRLLRLYPLLKESLNDVQVRSENKRMGQKLGSSHSYFTVIKSDYCRGEEACSIVLQTTDGTYSKQVIPCATKSAAAIHGAVRSLISAQIHRGEGRDLRNIGAAEKALNEAREHDMAHGGSL